MYPFVCTYGWRKDTQIYTIKVDADIPGNKESLLIDNDIINLVFFLINLFGNVRHNYEDYFVIYHSPFLNGMITTTYMR